MADGGGKPGIQIFNDFVDVSTIQDIFRGEVWSFGWRSNTERNDSPFWHIHFCGGTRPSDKSLSDDLLAASPSLKAINNIWRQIESEVAPGYGLIRAYANGHTYGLEGAIHRDCKPGENELTALIYVNNKWKNDWSGETVFYDSSHECISVRPRPGRLVLFDGSIPHVARSPSRDCPELRITLVFKLRLRV